MTITHSETDVFTQDPLRFGVGARVTISVMTDNYVEVILNALDAVDPGGLSVATGDVSTWVGGHEHDVLAYLTAVTREIAATGHHASVNIHLSRGCPGEVACALPGGAGPRVVTAPQGEVTGLWAAAEWALYPLGTTTSTATDDAGRTVEPEHMTAIYAAIESTRAAGLYRGSEHYVTRLEGDLGLILGHVTAAWVAVGASVQHVTSHLTLSLNSPSHASATSLGDHS